MHEARELNRSTKHNTTTTLPNTTLPNRNHNNTISLYIMREWGKGARTIVLLWFLGFEAFVGYLNGNSVAFSMNAFISRSLNMNLRITLPSL